LQKKPKDFNKSLCTKTKRLGDSHMTETTKGFQCVFKKDGRGEEGRMVSQPCKGRRQDYRREGVKTNFKRLVGGRNQKEVCPKITVKKETPREEAEVLSPQTIRRVENFVR